MENIRDLPWIKQYKSFERYIKKLSSKGVSTTLDLLTKPNLYDLALRTEIPLDTLEDVKKRIVLDIGNVGVTSAFDIYNRALNLQNILKTGSSRLDKMLHGGFKSGYLYEMIGDDGTGKTHLCHHLCIEVASSGHKCLYIDTKACLSAEKFVIELKRKLATNYKNVLTSILVQQPTDVFQLFDILQFITDDQGDYKNIELLVIDSLDALVEPYFIRLKRDDWVGDQNTANLDRNHQFNSVRNQQMQFSRDLTTMLKQLLLQNEKLCIVVVNSSNRWLGAAWKKAAHVILTNRKLHSEDALEVRLTKSAISTGMNKCNVDICDLGFKDHQENNFENENPNAVIIKTEKG